MIVYDDVVWGHEERDWLLSRHYNRLCANVSAGLDEPRRPV